MEKDKFIFTCIEYIDAASEEKHKDLEEDVQEQVLNKLEELYNLLATRPEYILTAPAHVVGMVYYVMKKDMGEHATPPRAPDGTLYN